MDEILEVINDDGKTLWDFMVNGIQTGEIISSSIDRRNDIVLKEVTKYENKMNKIINGYSDLDACDDILKEYLKEIKNNFDSISLMANRFKRIKVLAKIEFARLDRNDNAHIKNIEKIIDVFIDFTKENENVFTHIEKTLVKDIHEFSILREEITEDLYLASDTIRNSKEELQTVKNAVKNTIAQLVDITSDLYKDIHYIINEFQTFGDMSDNINEIQGILDEVVMNAMEIKKMLLETYELEKWQSTNDYYEAIEEKFTSYIERKTANETFKTDDVDTGSEGGELT
jgi:methyl-accepting chemotaxis protein